MDNLIDSIETSMFWIESSYSLIDNYLLSWEDDHNLTGHKEEMFINQKLGIWISEGKGWSEGSQDYKCVIA